MKTQRAAVVDIGSNSIRSLIVEGMGDGNFRVLDDERELVRLASGITTRGYLSLAAMARAMKALGRMSEIIRARGVIHVAAVATSAVRLARNRKDFIDRVRMETGLRVRVISGEEEGQLAFESAASAFEFGDQPVAVADIGGGSAEIVLALGRNIQSISCLPIGAVRLTEQFLGSDPADPKEFKDLRKFVRKQIRGLGLVVEPAPQFLVASGGTATTLAQIAMSRSGLSGREAHGFEMTQADVVHVLEALLRRNMDQRRQMQGVPPDRADIIVAGVAALSEMMSELSVNILRVNTRGIRDALLRRLLRKSGAIPTTLKPRDRMRAVERFGRGLRIERPHVDHVKSLALSIFDQLHRPLEVNPEARELLAAASLLHDIGYAVSFKGHHKHSYHLIVHASLEGFTPREKELIAQVARYHRGTPPTKRHEKWAALAKEDRLLVRQLAAFLRLADALDRRHTQRVQGVICRATPTRVRFVLSATVDVSVEIHTLQEKSNVFQKVFGRTLNVEQMAPVKSRPNLRVLG